MRSTAIKFIIAVTVTAAAVLSFGGPSLSGRATVAQAVDACTPITAANAAALVQTGSVNVGTGERLKWGPGSDALYAIGTHDVSRIDVATMVKTSLFTGAATVLDFDPASGLAALTSNQTTIQTRDLFAQQDKITITPTGQFGGAALAPGGGSITIGLLASITEELRRTSDGGLIRSYTGFMTGAPVYSASFTNDGLSLIWLSRARVQIMNLASGTFGPAFEHSDFVMGIAQADSRLATAFGAGLRLWDTTSGANLADFTTANGFFGAALKTDTSLILGGNKSDVLIYDTASKAMVADITKPGTLLALSPDECKLAAGSADGAVVLLTAPAAPPATSGGSVSPPNTGDGGLK